MEEFLVEGYTLPEAYHYALSDLHDYGAVYDCPDWDTTCKELSMTMVVDHPTTEPMISKLMIGGPRELQQYLMEMLDGILDFEIEKGNWTYTYHDRMTNYPYRGKFLDQVQFVIDELKRNPFSRRAVIVVRDVNVDAGNNDPACLQHIQYFIRDGKLHCKVLFRSNDAVKATFMNAFALIMLQERIAKALQVDMGSYTHRANSFHCYEKDFELLEGYIKKWNEEDIPGTTYDYEDDWKEIMEEYIPVIEESVKILKSN